MIQKLLEDPQIHTAIVNIAMGIATIVATLAGRAIVAAGKYFVTKTKTEHNALYGAIAQRLVAFVEQKMAGASDIEKAQYVADAIKKKFPELPSEEVNHILEAAVITFKAQIVPDTATASVVAPDGTTAAATTETKKEPPKP